MTPPALTLRTATLEDSRQLWEWRNEPGMRAACFNTDPIPLAVHEAWLGPALADPARRLLVGERADGTPVGYLRFDEVGVTAEISVCIDPGCRGLGYGAALIRAGVEDLASRRPHLEPVALVKQDNPASARAFTAAGFVVVREVEIHGVKAVDMRPPGREAGRP